MFEQYGATLILDDLFDRYFQILLYPERWHNLHILILSLQIAANRICPPKKLSVSEISKHGEEKKGSILTSTILIIISTNRRRQSECAFTLKFGASLKRFNPELWACLHFWLWLQMKRVARQRSCSSEISEAQTGFSTINHHFSYF